MKYIVMLGDGMADYPVLELGGKTPLEAAQIPNMDFLAQHGVVGMVKNVPEGMPPGSDTANLSMMGYDPKIYYSGRSPLEAVSMGIALEKRDVTFRCNLVNLSDVKNYEDATMIDYSSDEITTKESTELIHYLGERFNDEKLHLYPGISYRHCLVLKNAQTGSGCTPPHDIALRPVRAFLPKGRYGELLLDMMKRSYELLREHPVNLSRIKRGLRPANSCWFWGEGTKPDIMPFEEIYKVKGSVVSAVDLIKGIGICAGMKSVDVEGATGNIHTNFENKAEAALTLLEDGYDLVYIHIEAPDECGHRHEIENKVKSIELIDQKVLGRIMSELSKKQEPYSILLGPDHPTPLSIRTHTAEPVPFVLYRSDRDTGPSAPCYTENYAAKTGLDIPQGHTLMGRLIKGDF